MRIVVTGPTGVVGIPLIKRYIREGHEVLAICRPGSSGIKQIPVDSGVKVLEADLEELKNIPEQKESYDVFYHMAWEGTTGSDRENKALQDKNVAYALDAVRLASRLGCHTFIGTGSQAEYGRSNERLTPQMPTHPENEYGRAKLQAGMCSRKECERLGLKHIWVRILSVYGPDGKGNDVISKTIETLKKGKEARFTPAEQVWDFLFSEDAAEALYRLAEKGHNGKIYVLGSGEKKTLKEYILILKDVLQRDGTECGNLRFGAVPYGEKQVMHLSADITELTADTGFVPLVSFEEGIEKLLRKQ